MFSKRPKSRTFVPKSTECYRDVNLNLCVFACSSYQPRRLKTAFCGKGSLLLLVVHVLTLAVQHSGQGKPCRPLLSRSYRRPYGFVLSGVTVAVQHSGQEKACCPLQVLPAAVRLRSQRGHTGSPVQRPREAVSSSPLQVLPSAVRLRSQGVTLAVQHSGQEKACRPLLSRSCRRPYGFVLCSGVTNQR